MKTTKVGGTSFEIALSKYCSDKCVITKITSVDEQTRQGMGLRSAQNFIEPDFASYGDKLNARKPRFKNHSTAQYIYENIPRSIWESYKKVTIVRNPFDRIVSRYFWNKSRTPDVPNFSDFVKNEPKLLHDNLDIAPISGPYALDIYMRYHELERDIAELDIDGLWELFQSINAKKGHRPAGASMSEMFRNNPELIAFVVDQCSTEIERFGFEIPSA